MAKQKNTERPDKRIEIEKICPHCKTTFKTLTGSKSKTFCSRSCASAGSMTEERRAAQRAGGLDRVDNFISVEEVLYLREAWKYKKIEPFLKFQNEPYQCEFRVGEFIFDLALIRRKVLVEFDGVEHSHGLRVENDAKKDAFAQSEGWTVVRIPVDANTVIEASSLYGILS